MVTNRTGNELMTVAGTGDVLAGVLIGLIAQGVDLFDAAVLSARITGLAGDSCLKETGGVLASKLITYIPKIARAEGIRS